ncbi:MAG: hypothetical protein ACR2KL_09720 [Nocardioidaceae bacterium]
MLGTVAGLKGGTGKTTASILVAEVATERYGSALLVDADPQGFGNGLADGARPVGGAALCCGVRCPPRTCGAGCWGSRVATG